MWSTSIRVPTSFVCFGKLKHLKLLGITFTLDSINNLELSLPVLKKFEMINCTWLSANAVTLVAPLLESVLLHIVEVDPPKLRNYAIKFSASHLTEFSCMIFCYVSPLPQQIVMLDPSSAYNASVSIVLEVHETGFSAFQLLKQFNQVKYLEFQGAEVMAQSNVADLPLFGMLSHLELLFVAGEVLLGLLLKSPILKTLVLQGISNFDEELLNSATVPHCLKSTLQVVKFVRVHGSVHELCSAKFIMENGTVLKRMSFSIDHWVEKSKAIEDFKEKILSFKKSFPFTIEGFSDD